MELYGVIWSAAPWRRFYQYRAVTENHISHKIRKNYYIWRQGAKKESGAKAPHSKNVRIFYLAPRRPKKKRSQGSALQKT